MKPLFANSTKLQHKKLTESIKIAREKLVDKDKDHITSNYIIQKLREKGYCSELNKQNIIS